MSSDHIEAGPELLERGALSRTRLWYESLRQQSRLISRTSPDITSSQFRTRVRALQRIDEPVFILGCPRSGTTYLGTLLAELRDSTYIFEPQILKYYVRLLMQNRAGRVHALAVYKLGLRSLVLAGPGHGPRPIEKNPNHVFVVDQLLSMFPNARFVIITRDGRDVAVSLREKPWHRADSVGVEREPAGYLSGPFPHFYIESDREDEYRRTSDIHRCIWIWRRHQEVVEQLRQRDDLSQHHIRYEELVARPNETLEGLCDFLATSNDSQSAVLARAMTGRTSSVGRWRDALTDAELRTIDEEAGDLLRSLGYD